MEAQWGGGVRSVSKIILVVRIQFCEAVGLRSYFLAGSELEGSCQHYRPLTFLLHGPSIQASNGTSNPSC